VTRDEILSASPRQLLELLRGGHPIDPDALRDREYHGTSLGLPRLVERLTWTRFFKVFEGAPDGSLRGWNCSAVQATEGPWTLKRRRGHPLCYGWYRVLPTSGRRLPWGTSQGLLIDYGEAGNRRLDPLNRVRDPLVSLDEGQADRLLGFSYVELGPMLVHTPAFFLLERGGPLSHRATPPRGW
jgi:hypothetical protein